MSTNQPKQSDSDQFQNGRANPRDTVSPLVWRFNLLATAFVVVSFLIVIQLVRLRFTPQAPEIVEEGDLYTRTLHTFYPPRGQIYDRWGSILAGNTLVYELGVQVKQVYNPERIAFALSTVLSDHPEYDRSTYYDEVFSVITRAQLTNTAYVQLADFVTPAELAKLQDWSKRDAALPDGQYAEGEKPSLHGLVYRPRMERTYPEKSLASNILGFVNRQGQGLFGVEERYNDLLAGDPQSVWISLDPYDAPDLSSLIQSGSVKGGADLVLTIDRQIQAVTEHSLDQALKDTGAVGGTILVMDPKTGEMLAMASTPRLDLNEYYNYGQVFPERTPFNKAISEDYEPGSVFKVLTMASALDAGAVKPDTAFLDTGSIEIGGILIHNWDYGAWGMQDMQGCLQHSLNVCLTWVATQLGANRFYPYLQDFGIGHLTGIDLAAEVPGHLKLPGDMDWFEADLGTNSFGQGVAVTPLQMIMAIASVANQGNMMAPHVVRSIIQDGYQYNPAPQVVASPIKAKTARQLTNLLSASLENESSDALVTGYRIAGKTGTAEIPGPGGYLDNQTNASFVGWGPVDDPRFIVYIWLERPTSSPWGSVVAAPVFRDLVKQLVILMDIPPDDVRAKMGAAP